MKYTSILAGFFGLMALAACTNNDEVSMEQPKEVHTITVAYNKGANTRVQLSSSEDFYKTKGFKGTWESDDKIKLVAESGTEYIYSIVAETIDEESGTATLPERENQQMELTRWFILLIGMEILIVLILKMPSSV